MTQGTGFPVITSPLASGFAGASGQQPMAEADQLLAARAQSKALADRQTALQKAIGDLPGTEETQQDRDADGRLPWQFSDHPSHKAANNETLPEPPATPHSIDPDGKLGRLLDIDA